MKITIAHSPDSDDAFMFYGLARGGVATGELEVSHVLTDIETLNRHAQEGRHEVTAISFHAYPHVAERYGKPSQVSVERVMGCGMGGCYSCVIPVKDAGGGQHYVRSCIGGPVFKGAELVWD